MKCPWCEQTMEKGYITSDARAIAWRKEKHESAIVHKKDGIQLARKMIGTAIIANAYSCLACEKVILDYGKTNAGEDVS